MTIGKVIEGHHQNIVFCLETDTVREAAGKLANKRIGALPIFDETGSVTGIFSERDLLYSIARDELASLDTPLREVMTAPAITVTPQTEAIEALSLMTKRRIRHLPVLEQGELIAFVSIGDLVKYRLGLVEAEAEQLREYIQTA
ncbi:CBS domain-containing protein [Altericroceibacterium spongiae]|uniref:CBS domain-containing protein n=1 Tax=Altericroceibacterium spongiae TaxID=2320269 RepID=A0A420EEC2_9SPHN|nr:CBS domain-containing protein [Altericroceibacterium spongiae]RKF19037.1 CBS domain-containing protein [Altericroceibacterium spongiae]